MARSKLPEYAAWRGAKDRCTNPKNRFYARYGGRGIHVYPAWLNDFVAFYQYIGPKPSPKLTLERIDNDGHYEPGNVKWATWSEQKLNSTSGPPRMDLTGQQFGRLTALYAEPKRPRRMTHWICRCVCGTYVRVGIGKLRTGNTRSCGCLHRDYLREVARRKGTFTSSHLPT